MSSPTYPRCMSLLITICKDLQKCGGLAIIIALTGSRDIGQPDVGLRRYLSVEPVLDLACDLILGKGVVGTSGRFPRRLDTVSYA
jgi:hypothetical protein